MTFSFVWKCFNTIFLIKNLSNLAVGEKYLINFKSMKLSMGILFYDWYHQFFNFVNSWFIQYLQFNNE